MRSEITEEDEEDEESNINKEAERYRIRQIIDYQKSLHWSSSSPSSFSSSAASCSSFSSSRKSRSLLELMKRGSTSLRRLFDMEHTSLATHFEDYSGSPLIKTIPLWGSDTDDGTTDYWAPIRQTGTFNALETDTPSRVASDGSFMGGEIGIQDRKVGISRQKLTRKKSFRKLPRFRFWRFRGFIRFRMRSRIRICGRLV